VINFSAKANAQRTIAAAQKAAATQRETIGKYYDNSEQGDQPNLPKIPSYSTNWQELIQNAANLAQPDLA